jgi:hypothetical protein
VEVRKEWESGRRGEQEKGGGVRKVRKSGRMGEEEPNEPDARTDSVFSS